MIFVFNQAERAAQLNERFSSPLSPDYDRWELVTDEEDTILNAHIFDTEGVFEENYFSYEELAYRLTNDFGGNIDSNEEWINYMVNNKILLVK
jgi:hypothetical protein